MITSIPITIDLTKSYLPHINLVQGESAGRRLSFTFVSGGAAVDLTGKIIILIGVKPSGLVVTSALTITAATSGKAYTDVLTQLVAEFGELSLQTRIFTPGVTGTATSGGATYLYDTSKSWTAGAYVGQWLYVSSGTGAGQARRITANTATQLTISDAWGANPAAGSGYTIINETGYSFPFAATVAASPNADAAIVSSSDFSALTAALATAAGLDTSLRAYADQQALISSPVGEIKMWPTTTPPEKYLVCDGSLISRTTYADLFTVIGTAFGAGNGSTTFALPDFRHRAPFGYDASNSKFNAIGKTGGEEAHTLTIDEMPSHNHDIGLTDVSSQRGYLSVYGSNYGVDGIHAVGTSNRGGGQAHNNLPSYIAIPYIIRVLR